jgi:hypothetical protein
MNTNPISPTAQQSAAARPVLLGVLCALLGLGMGVWLARQPVFHAPAARPPATDTTPTTGLSPATQQALAGLTGGVELRWHAFLPESRAAEPWREFAGRVERLLVEFERAANGRLRVTRVAPSGEEAARAAARVDGVEVFALGREATAVLGLRVTGPADQVTLARLAPEWEAALEFDLARAILRAGGSSAAGGPGPAIPETLADLEKVVPDWQTLPLGEAEEKLRAAALAEFKAATQTMTAQIAEAQQRLAEARATGNANQLNAAQNALQRLQAEQAEQLTAIARRMETQLQALRQLRPPQP